MGAVLVHIDLDGDRPHTASVSALAAGRAVASSWGATLYAVLLADLAETHGDAAVSGEVVTAIGQGGADKLVVAPRGDALEGAWHHVLSQLRPRLVLFGADAPSAAILGARTRERLDARLLEHAHATEGDDVELCDAEGDRVHVDDSGVAVALIREGHVAAPGDEDIDVVMLSAPGDVR